jgi:hypothetical protein
MPGYFFLQHPAILEDRRRKLRPEPPPQSILDLSKPKNPEDLIPIPPPKKIKNVVRKRDKKVEVEIIEQPVDEPVVITKKKTATIKKNAKPIIDVNDEPIINLEKRVSTISLKSSTKNNLTTDILKNDETPEIST